MAGGPADASESELIAGCRRGDAQAAETLIRRHQTALFRVVVRLVRRKAAAEEIVQETFTRAIEQIGRLEPRDGLGPWLYRVAINLSRDHLRRSRWTAESAVVAEDADVLHVMPAVDPEARAIAVEERQQLELALASLSPKLREIAVLHYVEGIPLAEIARMLRIPSGLARVRALRARAHLTAALGGRS